MSASLICASASAPTLPLSRLGEAGGAAFGAFGLPAAPSVEFATRDPLAAQKWLSERLPRPVRLPPTPSGVSLVGARMAPASRLAAGFLLYETGGNRLGLLVQALDAPRRTPPKIFQASGWKAAVWTDADQGFALIGEVEPSSLRRIAIAFFDPAYEFAPPSPDRGS